MIAGDKGALARKVLAPGSQVLVAVSGGADSLALLFALKELGYPITAASFDHQLRQNAGAEDVAYVSSICQRHSIPFHSGNGDVGAFAKQYKLSIEEAARDMRYRFLFGLAQTLGMQALATGHTADDQAETVLMHFLRGAGLDGLKGMEPTTYLQAYSSQIPLVRPILDWTRSDTEEYCTTLGLSPRSDETNTQTKYFRNNLRLQLMPLLKQYNPNLTQTLARNAQVLQADAALLDKLAAQVVADVTISAANGYIQLDRRKLIQLGEPLHKRVLRNVVFGLAPGLRDFDKDAVDRVVRHGNAEIGGGLKTLLEGNDLWVTLPGASLPNLIYPQILVPTMLKMGQNQLANGWQIEMEMVDANPINNDNDRDLTITFLDPSKLTGQLRIRNPHLGDKIEPLGMPRQHTKLTDLFINTKVPKRYRAGFPIVTDENTIVWVPGLRRSENAKTAGQASQVLRLVLTDLN